MTCLHKSLFFLGTLSILVALLTPAHGVVAHERCQYNDTQEGRCLTEEACSQYHPEVNNTLVCGNEKGTKLICCPLRKVTSQSQNNPLVDDDSSLAGEVAKKWCNYYTSACSAIGNTDAPKNEDENELAEINEFPYMAAIGYGDKEDILWGCGGSLISENFVLTTANCLQHGSSYAAWVRLGAIKIKNHLKDVEPEGQIHPVIKRFQHPEFKSSSKYYDIALLKIGLAVGENVVSLMSKSIHPACLLVNEKEISPVLITGWGSIGNNEDTLHLQKLSTNIYENSNCNETFHSEIHDTQQLSRGIDESMICAKSIGTCKGDSGGSLEVINNQGSCPHRIIGVTSFAKSCTYRQSIAVYSRVSYYIKWIVDQVWKGREICSLGEGQYGECRLMKDCSHAISLISENKKPINCGFNMKEPIVCCPFSAETNETFSTISRIGSVSEKPINSASPGYKARKACEKYKSICESKSDGNELYSHMALIGYGELKDIIWGCGGSLISENFVLIAAHCITDIENKIVKWVRLGSYSTESHIRRSSNGSVIGQVHPVLKIIKHPGYDKETKSNDLALLKIGEAVESGSLSTLSREIHPACLQSSLHPIKEAIGLGISEIGTGDHLPLKIQKAKLGIMMDSACNDTRISSIYNNKDSESFLCTQVLSKERFLCTFNSEGPLIIKNQKESLCSYNVVGVSTVGQLCGYNNEKIIYTQIWPHIKWIEDNVWPQ